MQKNTGKVLALSGGVGGAKLALGLSQVLPRGQLQVAVNTADDFVHLGLHISPDIDTLLYTLSGRSNETLGWGLAGETWQAMDALDKLGGDTWFRLGDRDLATHLLRTQAITGGRGLARVTDELALKLGLECGIHPMSDQRVSTIVHTDEGDLPFQHYFVRRQCEPAVTGFHFDGIEDAKPNPVLMDMLKNGEVAAVVICPSNPFVSVDPILKVPGFLDALNAAEIPIVAVSPIVAGLAIKGPAAKMMAEMAIPVTASAVAQHYQTHYPGLLDCFVIDESDGTLAGEIRSMGIDVAVTNTIMKSLEDKRALAGFVLDHQGVAH